MEEQKLSTDGSTRSFGLNSFWLKLIAVVLMTLDHYALLFIYRGTGDIPLDYYILRAIGKMAFPIYAFLAVEGIYHTKNPVYYFLRLAALALGMDCFGFIAGAIWGYSVWENPLIGNAATDMLMGVLMIYFLRKKNWFSLFAILPVLYEVFSDFPIDYNWGTLFKSDWGTFSIVLFLLYYLAREGTDLYLKNKAVRQGLEPEVYFDKLVTYHDAAEAVALIATELIFYLIYRIDYSSWLIPNEFIPIGTYSTLAFVFILLYNGKKGYSSKAIQYSFYAYYPLHLIIMGIISMFTGVLASL